MITFWLITFAVLSPTTPNEEFVLDTHGTVLPLGDPFPASQHMPNGDVLIGFEQTLWHWDSQGSLIRSVRLKADEEITNFFWDDDVYWIFLVGENGNDYSKIYDKAGNFLFKYPLYFHSFAFVDSSNKRLLAVDLHGLMAGLENPIALKDLSVSYQIDTNNIHINENGAGFFEFLPRQRRLGFNFKSFFADEDEQDWFIIDQLTPSIWRYPKKDVNRSKSLAHNDLLSTRLRLTLYRTPPSRLGRTNDLAAELRKWSRFNFFRLLRDGYLIGYQIPNPVDPYSMYTALEVVNKNGTPVREPLIIEGNPIGFADETVFSVIRSTTTDKVMVQKHAL